MKILCVGDPHAEPGISNKRFKALGNLIVKERPDVVVCIGDFASLDSLSSYDKGKKAHEGRRYKKDIAAANEALQLIMEPFKLKKVKRPRFVITLGNHEDRINRAVESSAELDGTMSINDIDFKRHGWEVYDYLEVVPINGVHFSHYFISGVLGRPISGENTAASILKKHYVSCVAGHSHIFDYAERTRADGRKINGVVIGCYFDHSMPYASATEHLHWAGVTILDDVVDGDFDIRRISLKRILKEYLY